MILPSSRALLDAQRRIGSEIIEAQNIKSRVTRSGVAASLGKVASALRAFKETPSNGLAIFASPDNVWSFEPPEPFAREVYFCGPVFKLEPLQEMLESKQMYGLVVIDRKEASIGLLHGKSIKALKNLQSMVPQKVNRGGSSQARIQRQVDNAVAEWFDRVANVASDLFSARIDDLAGIIVGGPGDTRRAWLAAGGMDYRVRAKVLPQTFDTGYTDDYQGFKELVAQAETLLVDLEITTEKRLLERFFDGVRTGRSVYGTQQVREALDQGRVELLLVDERGLENWNEGVEIACVSDETELGKQFLKMGGVGALLRW